MTKINSVYIIVKEQASPFGEDRDYPLRFNLSADGVEFAGSIEDIVRFLFSTLKEIFKTESLFLLVDSLEVKQNHLSDIGDDIWDSIQEYRYIAILESLTERPKLEIHIEEAKTAKDVSRNPSAKESLAIFSTSKLYAKISYRALANYLYGYEHKDPQIRGLDDSSAKAMIEDYAAYVKESERTSRRKKNRSVFVFYALFLPVFVYLYIELLNSCH